MRASPSGAFLVTTDTENSLKVWSLLTFKLLFERERSTHNRHQWSKDETLLAVLDYSSKVIEVYHRTGENDSFDLLLTEAMTVRDSFMVEFGPTGSYLVKADERHGLTILKRRSENDFGPHDHLPHIRGRASSLCWAAPGLILVGLGVAKDKAKIDIVDFEEDAQPGRCLHLRDYSLELHTASVDNILVGR